MDCSTRLKHGVDVEKTASNGKKYNRIVTRVPFDDKVIFHVSGGFRVSGRRKGTDVAYPDNHRIDAQNIYGWCIPDKLSIKVNFGFTNEWRAQPMELIFRKKEDYKCVIHQLTRLRRDIRVPCLDVYYPQDYFDRNRS